MDQEKTNHVNSLTLAFRDSDKERQYQEDPDIGKIQAGYRHTTMEDKIIVLNIEYG